MCTDIHAGTQGCGPVRVIPLSVSTDVCDRAGVHMCRSVHALVWCVSLGVTDPFCPQAPPGVSAPWSRDPELGPAQGGAGWGLPAGPLHRDWRSEWLFPFSQLVALLSPWPQGPCPPCPSPVLLLTTHVPAFPAAVSRTTLENIRTQFAKSNLTYWVIFALLKKHHHAWQAS